MLARVVIPAGGSESRRRIPVLDDARAPKSTRYVCERASCLSRSPSGEAQRLIEARR